MQCGTLWLAKSMDATWMAEVGRTRLACGAPFGEDSEGALNLPCGTTSQERP